MVVVVIVYDFFESNYCIYCGGVYFWVFDWFCGYESFENFFGIGVDI